MSFPSTLTVIKTGSALLLSASLAFWPAQATAAPDRSGGKLGQWMVNKAHPQKAVPSAVPSIDEKAFGSELDALIAGKTKLGKLESGYRLKIMASENLVIYEDPTDHHPSLILNQKPRYDLILELPHAGLETGTVPQAAFLMQKLGVRAILLSGMHRCAASTYSSCDGKTSVCGKSEAYRTSDAAHSVDGLFHKMHQRLTRAWPKSLVVQLHEMRPSEMGPMVILSSTAKLKSDDAPVAGFRSALGKRIKGKARAFSCHNAKDLKEGFRLLCGFTNVQGRAIHGSSNACGINPTGSSERFLHIEQDYEISSQAWYLDSFVAALEELAKSKYRI